jgi:xanthine dehydrogenase accessory factor
MSEIYKRMIQELSSGRPVVLAAIIRQAGSSPRLLGAKFVVCHDGSLVGSVGKLEGLECRLSTQSFFYHYF